MKGKQSKNSLTSHLSESDLVDFLINKSRWSIGLVNKFQDHLNNCHDCWTKWNKVRWDKALNSRGMKELYQYLGHDFKEYFDSSWAIAEEWLRQNPHTEKEVAEFYKTNSSYLYNLVVWYESGDREDFKKDFDNLIVRFKVNSVIDYGCGVGNDGLFLLENKWLVNFVDYDCPSVDFLKWRMKKRNVRAPVLNVEEIDLLPEMDMFWAIDVLEHMKNPLWAVERLPSKTRVFAHRSQFGNNAGGRHPCHFCFDEMKLGKALSKRGFKHIPWPVLSVWIKN